MQEVTEVQRRARLATRHALAVRAESVDRAVEQLTCLHATEPASVYLSAFARVECTRGDVDRALYEDRSVVKQLAMRRTIFVFPRDLLPAVWGSASERVARQLHARLAQEVASNGLDADGHGWVEKTLAAVLDSLATQGPATTAQLRERLPLLSQRLELSPGKSYGGSFPIASRVMSTLGATGQVMRGENAGDWHVSRPRWTLTEDWLGEPVRHADPVDGYRELVRRWLHTFGPGTEADLVWWLGATKGVVRRALGELGAVEVRVGNGVGYLLPDDLEDVAEPEPWAALLPVLDPTTMGWKERGFYLPDEDAAHLFDRNGNAGTTAWWDGRIVGCWVQDPDGAVAVVLRRDLGSEAVSALNNEAARLTGWLAGKRVGTVYWSALMKSATSPVSDPRPQR
jgi:hypothetical protein